jgi:hypothetical protein
MTMTDQHEPFAPHQWYPISAFNKEQIKDGFIVWLPDGRFNEGYLDEAGNFDGEWRHIATVDGEPADDVRAMEPVAFMLISAPEIIDGSINAEAA